MSLDLKFIGTESRDHPFYLQDKSIVLFSPRYGHWER